jgi:hypothetical protein
MFQGETELDVQTKIELAGYGIDGSEMELRQSKR